MPLDPAAEPDILATPSGHHGGIVLICGHDGPAIGALARAICRSSAAPAVLSKSTLLSVEPSPSKITVLAQAADVFALKRFFHERGPAYKIRIVMIVRDPRDLVVARSTQVDDFAQGFDHNLHVTKKGLATRSEPGILYTQSIIENAANRDRERVMVLRHEDLEHCPDLVQLALAKFTGLDFARRFSALLDADPAWKGRRPGFAWSKGEFDAEEAGRIARQFRLAPPLFEILERLRYVPGDDRRWLDELARQAPHAADDSPGTVVGFFTRGTRYEQEADRLRRSLESLKLPYRLLEIEAETGWLAAVRRKPGILLEMRRQLRGPVLYVDVDAIVHDDPWPYMRGYRQDVAVAGHHGSSIISGTLLLNDTQPALDFLRAWISAQNAAPEAWDQHSLESVVLAHRTVGGPFRVGYLPPEMCRVFDRKYNPPVKAVIEHLQASREHLSGSDDPVHIVNLSSRRRRLAELEGAFADQPVVARQQRTQSLLAGRTSDLIRWSNPLNLKTAWQERARIVAGLIEPGSRVLDLGCGAMDLERYIPPDCLYIPADLVKRDERTLLCDLNADQLPDAEADCVTALGVLEYCHDLERVFGLVAAKWRRFVVTYNPADLDAGRDRAAHGWFNGLTSAAFVHAASAAGFTLAAIVPLGMRERIYSFAGEA